MNPFPVIDGLGEVELQATRLDGESYLLAEATIPIGVPARPATRAVAALGTRHPRLIAARGTAAWIWGAARGLPPRGEYLVDVEARWRPAADAGIEVVESVVRAGDVATVGGLSVTSPLRTAIDLARFRPTLEASDAETLRSLARIGGFGAADAVAAMDRGRNLSGKRSAASRLRAALAGQPELTR
ncbi:MAG: hypothetical protein DI534_00670 [Leifsonia xyli]|nr:MAG: hypothetical protein DI534_00670 [Leifsonia xyli]